MTDDDDSHPENKLPSAPSSPRNEEAHGAEQYEMFPLERFLEIERQRIDSYNRRTEVARQAIEAQDAADQRQYEYHVKRLEKDDAKSQRQHSFAKRIFYYGGSFTGLVVGLILVMLFFGAPDQSNAARAILSVIAQAMGGAGFLYLLVQTVRWLLSR